MTEGLGDAIKSKLPRDPYGRMGTDREIACGVKFWPTKPAISRGSLAYQRRAVHVIEEVAGKALPESWFCYILRSCAQSSGLTPTGGLTGWLQLMRR
jgi:hypothetical protein